MNLTRLVVMFAALVQLAGAGGQVSFDFAAIRESLLTVPPKLHESWLREHDFDLPGVTHYRQAESTGLRMVGKYGRGRAWEVTGQDSFVYAILGSEAAILDFANPAQPKLVSEIQLDYLPVQVAVIDSVLLTGRNGIDLWNIADPTFPVKFSHIPSLVSDFAVVDTLLYFVSGDTFNAYNIARPAAPARIGFCLDSGYVATATANTAILLTNDFTAFVDVTNPAAPHRVGTYGGWSPAAVARGNVCFAAFANPSQLEESWFSTIDISDPANPRQLGRLDSVCSFDIWLQGSYAYTAGRAGYEPMQILNIADSTHPTLVGGVWLPGDGGWGVWADPVRGRAFITADWAGVQVLDITSPGAPLVDTVLLRADMAEDVCVDGNRAYVADYRSCLKILDMSDPTRPSELGGIDSAHASSDAAAAKDSFVYVGWVPPVVLRSVCVTDPLNPKLAGGGAAETEPEDMVLRDTLLYIAGRLRFNVVSVARPREPVLVGSCVIQGTGVDLVLRDTLAYVSSLPTQVINVRDPAAPVIVGTIPTYGHGIEIRDSFAFVPALYDSMVIYNISDPATPVRVARHTFSGGHVWNSGIALVDTLLYVGGDIVHVVDVADPLNPVEVGTWMPPYETRRLCYAAPYLYAASYDAGVCILETVPTGLEESPEKGGITKEVELSPSVTTGRIAVETRAGPGGLTLSLYDACGAKVMELQASAARSGTRLRFELNLSGLPDGIYFVSLKGNDRSFTTKVVKTKGR